MRVFMTPSPAQADTNNGIGQVIRAMHKYLPGHGITFTDDADRADVVAVHAGTATGPRVDLLLCHGLYWGDVEHQPYSSWHHRANANIIAAARRAKVVTVPSDWVAEPFRRDMRIRPHVIGHGIDFAEWQPRERRGYVLWNKGRRTDVCDPTPAWELARRGIPVVSTFAPAGAMIFPTLTVTGVLPFAQMKAAVEQAQVYLATTLETFGIGTLEAMASSVPVLGYDWGGTRDIVIHQETGYLAQPGNIDDLVAGYHWILEHYARLSEAAREQARRYDWPRVIERYLPVFERAAQVDPVSVAVVITNYNYGRWVGAAIESVLAQRRPADEIIVVDDGSTDDSLQILREYESRGKIRLIAQQNKGVAAARNNGIAAARSAYIVSLDADDMLDPHFIAACLPALAADRGLGVAYTGLRYIDAEGRDSGYTEAREFTWEFQAQAAVPPRTLIPSGCMFRREMWQRAGGYRQQYAPGEDAEFWTRGLSLGFTARLVTSEGLFIYRGHAGSASRTRKYGPIDDNKPWMRDGAYPMAAPASRPPAVRSYLQPVVSVIIPVGPGHAQLLPEAIESVIGQTVRDWELIVVDDTDNAGLWKGLPLYPFARVFASDGKPAGAGRARNIGLEKARGPFVLFLDADDQLAPDALAKMLAAHAETGRYVYSDYEAVTPDGSEYIAVADYDRELYRKKQQIHAVTALVPTSWAREVGGFDPDLPGWEEFDFYMKLAAAGYCGVCVHEPLLRYRLHTGSRRRQSHENAGSLLKLFGQRYGGVNMPGCCGGDSGKPLLDAKRALGMLPQAKRTEGIPMPTPDEVRLEYTGMWSAPVAYTVNGRKYYASNQPMYKQFNAPKEDAAKLLQYGCFRLVELAPVPPPPAPAPDYQVVAEPDVVDTGDWEPVAKLLMEQEAAVELDPEPKPKLAKKARKAK